MHDAAEAQSLAPGGLSPVEFERARLRPGAARYSPVPFGPNPGRYTLYVPPAAPTVQRAFQDGKPVVRTAPGVGESPELAELRDRILAGIGPGAGPGLLTVPLAFAEYAARLIQHSYDVSDEDLTFLLGGTRWHQAVIQHVFGGEQALRSIARFAPRLMPQRAEVVPIVRPAPPVARTFAPPPPAPAPPAPPPPSVFSRFKFWRR